MLAAVREDVRHTLRTAWLDPAIETAASFPVFFTAAWSAIRPNVGKSFLQLSSALRDEAVASVQSWADAAGIGERLGETVSDDVHRVAVDAARAAHLATAKAQIVTHVLLRAVRAERIEGSGEEEPPVRRGVPDWQRGVSLPPPPWFSAVPAADSTEVLSVPCPPAWLGLLARWPSLARSLWRGLEPFVGSGPWNAATLRLRRMVYTGISSLPHSISLQWPAIKERGFGEPEREALSEALAVHDAAMSSHTLTSAFVWLTLGAPEIGFEG